MTTTTTTARSSGRGIETTGIEIIEESQRTARPRDLFLPWFASNISVFGMSYGAFILGFGISLRQAVVATLVGVVVSFMLCGFVALAGKRGSAPTMVASRAAFGTEANKVPGIVSWITSIGWETSLAITAVLATTTIFRRLGWSSGTGVKVVSALVVAALIVAGAVAGYHIIMKLQSVLTWVTGVVTVVYLVMALPHITWSQVTSLPSGPWQATIGALTMVMTGMGLGWINIAADWSRYQSRQASGAAIVWWNTLGGSLGPVVLIVSGLLLAGSSKELSEAIAADPVGALASILPTWFLIPFLVVAILSLLSGAINGIYSSGLTLLSLGIRIPRPAASLVDGAILTAGTIYVVFFSPNFISPFQSFLVTLGVPLAGWAGIMLADITLRKRPYDDADLFDPRGRYGAVDVVSLVTLVVVTVIGWGLVINQYEGVNWNNWQGYLLGPLGLGGKDGPWAYANIGVLVALVLGYLVILAGRAHRVRHQEQLPASAPISGPTGQDLR